MTALYGDAMGRRARQAGQIDLIPTPAPVRRPEPASRPRRHLRGEISLEPNGDLVVRIEQPRAEPAGAPPPSVIPLKSRARCANLQCGRWCYSGALGGRLLGLEDAYCGACLQRYIARCLEKNGRLPARGEFYCRKCDVIRPRDELTPPDRDGRVRLICKPCRRVQVDAANERRRRRQ